MPTLEFKGKNHIYAHHLTVPYRPLEVDLDKSVLPANPPQSPHSDSRRGVSLRRPDDSGEAIPLTDQNLIIHGDNLHALKALLPQYAGRVKCIYIDPPYNTGNKDWTYNDRVDSPIMREWFEKHGPIDGEDMERHEKWLCMMWPRLHILKDLLRDDGVIFVSIDDHEQQHLRMLMDEVFDDRNFIDTLILVQNLGAVPGRFLREVNEYVHVYAKDINSVRLGEFTMDSDKGWDSDEWGLYRKGSNLTRIGLSGTPEDRPNLHFPIYITRQKTIHTTRQAASDVELIPQDGQGNPAVWRWGKNKVDTESHNLLLEPHRRLGYKLTIKIRPGEGGQFTQKPTSLWNKPSYSAATATNIMKSVFQGERKFDFPKAVDFVADIIRFGIPPPPPNIRSTRTRHHPRLLRWQRHDRPRRPGAQQRRRRQPALHPGRVRGLCRQHHRRARPPRDPRRARVQAQSHANRLGRQLRILHFGRAYRY